MAEAGSHPQQPLVVEARSRQEYLFFDIQSRLEAGCRLVYEPISLSRGQE